MLQPSHYAPNVLIFFVRFCFFFYFFFFYFFIFCFYFFYFKKKKKNTHNILCLSNNFNIFNIISHSQNINAPSWQLIFLFLQSLLFPLLTNNFLSLSCKFSSSSKTIWFCSISFFLYFSFLCKSIWCCCILIFLCLKFLPKSMILLGYFLLWFCLHWSRTWIQWTLQLYVEWIQSTLRWYVEHFWLLLLLVLLLFFLLLLLLLLVWIKPNLCFKLKYSDSRLDFMLIRIKCAFWLQLFLKCSKTFLLINHGKESWKTETKRF